MTKLMKLWLPLVAVAYTAVLWMLVVGIHDWRIWIPIIFLLLERIFVHLFTLFTAWMTQKMITALYTNMMEQLGDS